MIIIGQSIARLVSPCYKTSVHLYICTSVHFKNRILLIIKTKENPTLIRVGFFIFKAGLCGNDSFFVHFGISNYNIHLLLSLFILRLLVQAIDDVEQTVGGNDVAEGFRSALGIDGATDIGEVA